MMLTDNIDAEIRRAQRVKGNFSLLAVKLAMRWDKKDRASLLAFLKRQLPSEEDRVGFIADKIILFLLRGANKSSVGAWQQNVNKNFPKEIRVKAEQLILTYPEDGASRVELLKKMLEVKS